VSWRDGWGRRGGGAQCWTVLGSGVREVRLTSLQQERFGLVVSEDAIFAMDFRRSGTMMRSPRIGLFLC
jgi:hypothetical protein